MLGAYLEKGIDASTSLSRKRRKRRRNKRIKIRRRIRGTKLKFLTDFLGHSRGHKYVGVSFLKKKKRSQI
jgi:hypothetical protein